MSTASWLVKSRTAKVVAIWLAFFLVWEGAYRVVGWRPWLFPAPSHVVDATLDMLNVSTALGEPLHEGWPWRRVGAGQASAPAPAPTKTPILGSPLPTAILVSGVRLVVGFVISLMLGGMLGLLMWRYKFVNSLFGPVFLGLQTLPSVCWVPLAILVFGYHENGIIFVLVMGSFFAIAIALRDGLHQIPPIYKRAAIMLGARHWNLYRYVLLPAGLPATAASLRQGFSFAWRSLMGGELVFMLQRRGLGFLLNVGRDFSDIAQVIAIMAVMVLIGTLMDRLVFARIEVRVRRQFGLG